MERLLIANRGEIAIRIARAAAELDIATVAVYSAEDANSLHRTSADAAVLLHGRGARAYLDIEQLAQLACDNNCDALHPGYGFLSENAQFATALETAGINFVGPTPDTLALLGDKVRARQLARECEVAVLAGSTDAATLEDARAFFASLPDGKRMLIKAVFGGGGRGMRVVASPADLEEAYERCISEAQLAFGDPGVYVEEYLPNARHIEVQILGDGTGAVSHLWERECSIQRRHQKFVEIAPSPSLSHELRDALTKAAVRLAAAVNYRGLGTVEFMVSGERYAFIEANARLQVEHTVTEAVTGVDLVVAQLQVAAGKSLAELGLDQSGVPRPRGYAIQARINMETMQSDGSTRPAGGTLAVFEVPTGPGLRIDTYGYSGYTTSPAFDSLLAKLIVHRENRREAIACMRRALEEFVVDGVRTTIPLYLELFAHSRFANGEYDTTFVESYLRGT